MINNIRFDQVEIESKYNFANLFDKMIQDCNLPITDSCKYYSPEQVLNHAEHKHKANTLSVFSQNCQSLKSNWDNFKTALSKMSSNMFSFDVIALSEIFTLKIKHKNYKLAGYHDIKYKTRAADDDGHGGVALYLKDTLSFKDRDDISVFIPHIIETLFIEIISNHSKPIVIGSIYRPNTYPKDDINIFIKTLLDIVNILNDEKKTFILLGDFNIDLLKFETDNKTNDFIHDIIASGLIPHITKPTRVTPKSATLIDNIYSNIIAGTQDSGVILSEISDHFGVFSLFENNKSKENQQYIETRSFKEENINNFIEILSNTDFSTIYEQTSANLAYNNFIVLYKEAFEKAFPRKRIKVRKKFVKRDDWFTEGLLISSLTKQKLYKKKLHCPNDTNISKYKNYTTLHNKLKRQAKIQYYSNILNQYKNDIKQTWNILHSIINKSKQEKKLPSSFLINDNLESDSKKIADEFNQYFASIGKITSDTVPSCNSSFERHIDTRNQCSFFMNPIDPNDIILASKSLKPKLSQGYDNISTKLAKDTINEVAHPLAHIFNLSFVNGEVPDYLKLAKVIPIHKSGNNQMFTNYRPISLLPAFSKLLEKIVYNRLMTFLNKHELLYHHQYGFRKKYNTTHPILHLVKEIAEANNMPSKDSTIGIFLDLSKAFDTISHDILLTKLHHYGIRGISNKWFRSYLQNRRQFTQVNDTMSSIQNINVGVPQGSILGPLLFLIYVNDIKHSTNLSVLSFADDTTIFKSGSNENELFNHINNELQNIYTWLCENKLALNVNKTKYMIFCTPGSKILKSNRSIKIDNIEIGRVGTRCNDTSVKFLGIHLDETLTWNNHIKFIKGKMSSALFALNQSKKFLPTNILLTLYHSLIGCHLNYGLIIWGNSKSVSHANS